MAYFDKELKSTLIFAILGIIVGYISFLMNNNLYAFVSMIILAVVGVLVMKKALNVTEGRKWWIGNGLVVYVFLWLITWIVFYNLALR